ncbi:unnamed protein product [Candidula unifasciata]|uniref:Zinc transporter 1 n=1 Tax=Candidula unifasciata TaxID=100452 RepID=A0A8S3YY97_9EUPU|nr:unnamed protein product [Candidula unifasciata]
MGRYTGKTCRLSTMLALTASFFLVEIVVGYVTNSVALVADSFHMLSDVVALIVGFCSVRISKWSSKRNTYGWIRAEILGALVNAVFLLALCFSILVEALKRLVDMERVENPRLLLIVGGAGLVINIIGLVLFGGHGHSHGGHGHAHGGQGHAHGGHGHSHDGHKPANSPDEVFLDIRNGSVIKATENEALVPSERVSSATPADEKEIFMSQNTDVTIEFKKPKIASSQQLNMRGVFLHVLGDALGSLVVVISALVIMFADGDWRFYIDPAMSVFMVIIILSTTIPLLKESALILLQTVPSHVDVENIIKELEQMEGIYGVHECHIWQLAGNRIIASAHIRCHGIEEYMTLAAKIKSLFHKAGIHSTTIQPEFIDWQDANSEHQPCALPCNATGEQCKEETCCGDKRKRLYGSKPNETGVDLNDMTPQPGNTGSVVTYTSAQPCTFSSLRSLDLKFSPDGDEVVLEMLDIKKAVIDNQGASKNISQSPPPGHSLKEERTMSR